MMKSKKKKIASAVLVGILAIGITIFSLLAVAWDTSAELHAFLGEMYLDEMDYEQALVSFQRALDIEPKNEETYELMAKAYDKMGEDYLAAQTLRNAYLQTHSKDVLKKAERDYDVDVSEPVRTTEDEIVVKNMGMDICFVIDTTSSMDWAIADAKANMKSIIAEIAEKSSDYRVAIVDYRDFAERTGTSDDYPAKVQLDFTSDSVLIQNGIDGLTLGYGGDMEETVYSGLMLAASLGWRASAQHIVILIGDAPALSPEPISGYTYDDVLKAMESGSAKVTYKDYTYEVSDKHRTIPYYEGESAEYSVKKVSVKLPTILSAYKVAEKEEDKEEKATGSDFAINVYGIVTDSGADGIFDKLCEDMGGTTAIVGDDSSLSEEICGIIEEVEVLPVARDVDVEFGPELARGEVNVYRGMELVAVAKLDKEGEGQLKEMLFGTYYWKDVKSGAAGHLTVLADEDTAEFTMDVEPDNGQAVLDEVLLGAGISGGLLLAVAVLIAVLRFVKAK